MWRVIRRIAEAVLLGIMACTAIAIGLLELYRPQSLAVNIPEITLIVLGTITLFLFLEVGRFQTLDDHTVVLEDIEQKLSRLDLNAIAQDLKEEHYGGLIAVHKHLDENQFIKYMQHAQEITILNTWIPRLNFYNDTLVAALRRHVPVKILLLYPNSEVAQLRDEALRAANSLFPKQKVRQGIEECFEALTDVLDQVGEDSVPYLQVRLYNSLPSISVYKADEHFFVSVFFHGQLAIRSPQFEIEGSASLLGQHVMKELNILWEIGQEVEQIRNWRAEIDIMQF